VTAAEMVDRLPDGEVVTGAGGLRAWLVYPTGRYAHGVLGDAVEAAGIRVALPDGRLLTLRLPDDSVFEDRFPRFADLDGDGRDEIYLVRSYLDRGAALVVIDITDDALKIVAETVPIGRAQRWLNPVGAADLDGNGRMDIAVVITPHIGGTLAVYEFAGNRLQLRYQAEGFSNHAIGSRELRMSSLADVDGDGVDELLVPGADRYTLRIMSVKQGALQEIRRIPHDSPIDSAITVITGDRLVIRYRLQSAELIELPLR